MKTHRFEAVRYHNTTDGTESVCNLPVIVIRGELYPIEHVESGHRRKYWSGRNTTCTSKPSTCRNTARKRIQTKVLRHAVRNIQVCAKPTRYRNEHSSMAYEAIESSDEDILSFYNQIVDEMCLKAANNT